MSSHAFRACICLSFLSFANTIAVATQPSDFGCDGSTPEIGSCLAGLLSGAETNLNAASQNLISSAHSQNTTWMADLRATENKWKEFRELNCNFYGNYLKGGSGAGPYYLACKVRMTEERVAELRKLQRFPRSCETKGASPARNEPKWVKIARDNQGATATEICRKAGFKIAAEGRNCSGNVVAFDRPECLRDAKTYEPKTYGDCFKFYSCERAASMDGVNWDSILCQSAVSTPDPFDCTCIGNTVAQHMCLDKLHKDTDNELNTTYQSLIRLVSNHGEDWVQDLRLAERKWIEFRDQNCRLYGEYLKGDAGSDLYINTCKVHITHERVTELKSKQLLLIERGYVEVNQ